MDSKDLEAEIHPLKNEDGKLQENLGNQLKKGGNLKSTPSQSRLSRCRTVALFLSLFTCLLVVFVISFIIPCPERPVLESMWRIDYNAAGAPLPRCHALLGGRGAACVFWSLEVTFDSESTLSGCVHGFPGIWGETGRIAVVAKRPALPF